LKFTELKLSGSYIIDMEKIPDERGFFARTWDSNLFKEKGLISNFVQCNISFNYKKGTLRGLHYQEPPYGEAKFVRCTKGRVFEVMVDLRKNSHTYLHWDGHELNSNDGKMLYVPENFALGFQALEDNTELFYQMSRSYVPEFSRGLKWNDPKLKIEWPLEPTVISNKDSCFELI
jgi:dTDP-4-dehydrorhamnose 3,5-epimerase